MQFELESKGKENGVQIHVRMGGGECSHIDMVYDIIKYILCACLFGVLFFQDLVYGSGVFIRDEAQISKLGVF